ncbi:MAG: hypothetical protein M1812_000072 [Candelaria pacifica]|nr:MAG: hypothetical protein M1812_000072 [Candelaria pacifica]
MVHSRNPKQHQVMDNWTCWLRVPGCNCRYVRPTLPSLTVFDHQDPPDTIEPWRLLINDGSMLTLPPATTFEPLEHPETLQPWHPLVNEGRMATPAAEEIGNPSKGSKHWTEYEHASTATIMENLKNNAGWSGESLWHECARRLKVEYDVDRTWRSVASYWMRTGRKKSGVDERKKSNANAIPTTLEHPKKSNLVDLSVGQKENNAKQSDRGAITLGSRREEECDEGLQASFPAHPRIEIDSN